MLFSGFRLAAARSFLTRPFGCCAVQLDKEGQNGIDTSGKLLAKIRNEKAKLAHDINIIKDGSKKNVAKTCSAELDDRIVAATEKLTALRRCTSSSGVKESVQKGPTNGEYLSRTIDLQNKTESRLVSSV
jgi:hypothetical protein